MKSKKKNTAQITPWGDRFIVNYQFVGQSLSFTREFASQEEALAFANQHIAQTP